MIYMYTAEELSNKMLGFAKNYFLIDVKNDKESYYALTEAERLQYPLCSSGVFLNYVMDGELEKADNFLATLPEDGIFKLVKYGLTIVHPKVTLVKFVKTIKTLKGIDCHLNSVIITGGRPSILNGVNDFTRICPYIERHKDIFLDYFSYIYEGTISFAVYNLCLAEYYYQQNRLYNAEILANRTINEIDQDSERRLLFAALHLQSKILFAQGKNITPGSYIKNIKSYVKKNGEAEFSYNIDAAAVMSSFYAGDFNCISKWIKRKAPDEYADFNMLDTFRYLVKMRCYIIAKEYSAVIALAEKLRPILIDGKRHMDLCEISLFVAISLWRMDKKELALEELSRAMKSIKRFKYYRLLADEGEAILPILIEYINKTGADSFLKKLLATTRDVAIKYPFYLKAVYKNAQSFTQQEIDILLLLEQGKTREEIAELFLLSENTVKYHLKRIYAKLDAGTATQAVWQACIIGII